jgi:hypothetical protein
MWHLIVAVVALILFMTGMFSLPVSLALLVLMWVGGATAFQAMAASENKKLALLGRQSADKDPLACMWFDGEYISHVETNEDGLQEYYTVMIHRDEVVFYGYVSKERFQQIMRYRIGRIRVYHEWPFVLLTQLAPAREAEEAENA